MSEKSLLDYLIKNKEVYHLWFEYLKESDLYKNFCQYKANEVQRIEVFPGMNKTVNETLNRAFQTISGINETFMRVVSPSLFILSMPKIYEYWGDVFNTSWENIFEEFKNKLPIYKKRRNISITSQIDKYIVKYKKDYNKEPTVNQIRNYVSSLEKLPIPKPSRNLPQKEIDCLWRNLKIWKAVNREKLSLTEAIKKIDPENKAHKGESVNIQKAWKRDIRDADKIIGNVEYGEFPGPYRSNIIKDKKSSNKAY